MRVGEIIGGYVLTTNGTTAGGGQSRWAFARRGETEYFLKQFLAPTYPLPDGPGSKETKAEKLERCQAFERHHKDIAEKLGPISGDGGNLVVTKAFFRDGTRYYKATEKIDVSGLEPHDIAKMEARGRLLVMLTAVHSIETLHLAGLVHGDIKPPNVLIKRVGDNFSAKIIDFDNCFVACHPPPLEELVGDPTYYSPELMQYIVDGSAPEQLSAKTDVFALGVVFWQYTTGSLPLLPAGYSYPAEAAKDGELPTLPRVADSEAIGPLVASMLHADPDQRPGMKEIHATLKRIRRYGTADPILDVGRKTMGILRGSLKAARDSMGDRADTPKGPDGKLRGSLAAPRDGHGEGARPAPSDTGERKLRGSLLKKKP